jgi:hypothetical protein
MFEVNEQVKGVWVRILVTRPINYRIVTHNMLHMQLSWGIDPEWEDSRGQDDCEDERQQQRQEEEEDKD